MSLVIGQGQSDLVWFWYAHKKGLNILLGKVQPCAPLPHTLVLGVGVVHGLHHLRQLDLLHVIRGVVNVVDCGDVLVAVLFPLHKINAVFTEEYETLKPGVILFAFNLNLSRAWVLSFGACIALVGKYLVSTPGGGRFDKSDSSYDWKFCSVFL